MQEADQRSSRLLLNPHATDCIKRDLVECLQPEDIASPKQQQDYGVYCDRADCWDECELFKYRVAVNVVERGETVNQKASRSTQSYKHTLSLAVVIYSLEYDCDSEEEDCFDFNTGLAVLGDLQKRIRKCAPDLPISRIKYRGFSRQKETQGEIDLTVITAVYDIDYPFSDCDPNYTQDNTNTRIKKRPLFNG